MLRTVAAVLIASVALYLWGFVVWGLGPYPTLIWKRAADDRAAGAALRASFPERGVYFLPGYRDDPAEMDRLSRQGPVAMIHMLAPAGRPALDPRIMVQGFVLNVVALALIALLLRVANLPTYGGRVCLAALAGLSSAVLIDLGDVAWWQFDPAWQLYRAGYHLTFWILAGLILGAFVRPTIVPTHPA